MALLALVALAGCATIKGTTIAEQKGFVLSIKVIRWHVSIKKSLLQKHRSKMLRDMVSLVALIQIYLFLVVEVVTE